MPTPNKEQTQKLQVALAELAKYNFEPEQVKAVKTVMSHWTSPAKLSNADGQLLTQAFQKAPGKIPSAVRDMVKIAEQYGDDAGIQNQITVKLSGKLR